MYFGRRASRTRPPKASTRACASRIGNITRARNMSWTSSASFLTKPTFMPASRSPRRSRALACECAVGRIPQHVREEFRGDLIRLEHRFALAGSGPGFVALGNRDAVLARERADRFGKSQAFDPHDEIENAAAGV